MVTRNIQQVLEKLVEISQERSLMVSSGIFVVHNCIFAKAEKDEEYRVYFGSDTFSYITGYIFNYLLAKAEAKYDETWENYCLNFYSSLGNLKFSVHMDTKLFDKHLKCLFEEDKEG